jgi:hypothetical protein
MKCKCGKEFEPLTAHNSTIKQKMCVPCLIAKGAEKRIKTAKKEWSKEKAVMKDKLKKHSEWLNDLQKIFNTYIRTRDVGKPCISCDIKMQKSDVNAGHFFSVGAYPNLRFNEDNCHSQCIHCNKHLHSNATEYSIRLPYRIGQERYDKLLMDRNESNKLTVSEIKEKIDYYKKLTKELENKRL